jgi:hypothetical protein
MLNAGYVFKKFLIGGPQIDSHFSGKAQPEKTHTV